jgi:hypothetical protein
VTRNQIGLVSGAAPTPRTRGSFFDEIPRKTPRPLAPLSLRVRVLGRNRPEW